MPYRTQSPDTSREAEEALFERYRALDFAQRLALGDSVSEALDDFALQGILRRHPDASTREARLRLAALKYDDDLLRQAFDWDPAERGR